MKDTKTTQTHASVLLTNQMIDEPIMLQSIQWFSQWTKKSRNTWKYSTAYGWVYAEANRVSFKLRQEPSILAFILLNPWILYPV